MSISQLKCSSGYIEIIEDGRQGTKGDPGEVPTLGTTGQVLGKVSDASGDYAWIDIPSGINVFDIYSEADFPAPISGVSTLTSGLYLLKAPISLSAIEEFQCSSGAIIEFRCQDKENHTLTHNADNKTLFNVLGGSRFKIEHASFIIAGDGSTFITLSGSGFNSKANDFRVGFTGTAGVIGGTTNTASGGTNEFVDGMFYGFLTGLAIDNASGTQVLGVLFVSNTLGTGAILRADNLQSLAVNFNSNVFVGGVNESAYYIDPIITVPVQIQDNIFTGVGSFFKTGSLDQASKYINALGNGAEADSGNNASLYVNSNSATTSMTGSGVWNALNFTTSVLGLSSSRFSIVDASTGELQYDGLNPFEGGLSVSISVFKEAAAVIDHKFRVFKTLGTVQLDPITATRGLTTALASVALVSSLTLEPGERFRIEGASQGAATTITVADLSLTSG